MVHHELLVTLNYGNFIQTVIEFLIIAWAVFLMVKVLNRIRRLGEGSPLRRIALGGPEKPPAAPEKEPTEGPQK